MDTMRRTIEINQENKANNEQPTEAASVKCPNCGAIKGIQNGQSAECEYCGTQLKS
jgi:DNA-directed RNA polymerase subunit RPC12/RpoP